MMTKKQVKANYDKLIKIQDIVMMMVQKHETAMHTYLVGSIEKTLPQADIDGIIEDYKVLKQQAQDKFKELL